MTQRRGPIAYGTSCRCGHVFWRTRTHPETPRQLRCATALATARQHVGYRHLIGIAVYHALTENA